ncbi:MAG: magnesium and cobalt transport protein CorA [Arthrobacter sp.]|jgi:magnesium transporter|nr:magnesium and cobalt transport protein CorA [Arthrobacter sp.]
MTNATRRTPNAATNAHRFVDILGRRNPYPGGHRIARGSLTVSLFEGGEARDTQQFQSSKTRAALAGALEWVDAAREVGEASVPTVGGVAATAGTASGDDEAERAPERLVVVGIDLPQAEQIAELATVWDLHPLLVEDLLKAGQRPKLERYDDVLFVVTRAATYLDAEEEVAFSEFHVLCRGNVVVVLCQERQSEVPWAGARVPRDPELLRLGPEAMVYAFLDSLVDGYFPVLRGLDIDKEQIERQVFGGDAAVTERIYRLSQEVIDLQHAVSPLAAVLAGLRSGFSKYGTGDELRTYLQDVSDHLSRVNTTVAELRDSLNQILQVNSTLVTQRQNEDMKKISGWAAILFAPTLIGAIYGMNFDEMPELHWSLGYPLAVGAMVALAVGLWVVFRKKKWM